MAFKFETANERWRHYKESEYGGASNDMVPPGEGQRNRIHVPFVDPSELEDSNAAEQHLQNFNEIKQQVSDLYEAFVSDKISVDQLARQINDVARVYANKPVRY